jgi:hypothetical protein
MKKHILVIGVLCITIGIMLITSVLASAQGTSEFTVPLSDPAKRGKLKAHLNYGSITIKGTARKDVLVKYRSLEDDEDDHDNDHDNDNRNNNRHERPSKEGMKKIGGGGLDLEASENSNNVRVISNSWSNKLHLDIEVPAGFDLDVHTYNDGDLMISNIQGDLELTNYNGEITALNISGSVVATTYNGEIKVTFDKVKDGAPMSFSTYNGDIDLSYPATLKATLKMKTDQGEMYTGFDINMTSSGPVQKKDDKSGRFVIKVDDWKKGDINGGGAEITIKNYNGDIYVRKK